MEKKSVSQNAPTNRSGSLSAEATLKVAPSYPLMFAEYFALGYSPDIDQPLGIWEGQGRSSTPSTRLKIALFAPIPRARAKTADRVEPGFPRRVRAAKLTS